MEAIKKAVEWVVRLQIVPSGWLTIGSGVVSVMLGVLCHFGVAVPGFDCGTDPTVHITTGLGLIGLGRRSK